MFPPCSMPSFPTIYSLSWRLWRVIHPPSNMALDEIDIDLVAEIAVLIAGGRHAERRAEIIPVGVPPGIAGRRVGVSPQEQERFGAHAYLRDAMQNGGTVSRIERLEASYNANLLHVGRALGAGRLGHVGVYVDTRHDLALRVQRGLLVERQPVHRLRRYSR